MIHRQLDKFQHSLNQQPVFLIHFTERLETNAPIEILLSRVPVLTLQKFLKRFFSMNENNEDINDRIINGSSIYISRIKKPALRQVFYYFRYAYCSREISATCRNSSRSLDSSVRRLMRTSLSSALTITFSKNSSTGSRSAASSISAS